MLNYQSKQYLQSLPFKIVWAGFESDTLKLQNNGWTLAVEDQYDFVLARHHIRFFLKHDMLDLHCITEVNTFDFKDTFDYMISNMNHLPFRIHVLGKDIRITQMPAFNMASIKEIDARPQFVEFDERSIKDLSIFRTLVQPDSALIVEPDQISDLLAKIVESQSPKQAEIRERIRKAEARDSLKQTLHAQIISIAA